MTKDEFITFCRNNIADNDDVVGAYENVYWSVFMAGVHAGHTTMAAEIRETLHGFVNHQMTREQLIAELGGKC